MIINIPNREGVTLATQGKYCAENIKVVPTFEMSEGNTLNEFLKGTKTEITAEDLEGITAIRDYAFYNSPIESIELPNSITKIGRGALSRTNLISLEIPNIITILDYEFCGACSQLTHVKFGDGDNVVKFNGAYHFAQCASLISIELPKSSTAGAVGMFQQSGLHSIILPDNWTVVPQGFCNTCKLLSFVKMGSKITILNTTAFYNCTSLTEVICLAETPPTLNATALNGVPADCIFKVKSASVEAYKSATNWSVRADYIIALTPEEEALYGG